MTREGGAKASLLPLALLLALLTFPLGSAQAQGPGEGGAPLLFSPEYFQRMLDQISADTGARTVVQAAIAQAGGIPALSRLVTICGPTSAGGLTRPGLFIELATFQTKQDQEIVDDFNGVTPTADVPIDLSLTPDLAQHEIVESKTEMFPDYYGLRVKLLDARAAICIAQGLGSDNSKIALLHEFTHYVGGVHDTLRPFERWVETQGTIVEAFDAYALALIDNGPTSEVKAYSESIGFEIRNGLGDYLAPQIRALFDASGFFINDAAGENRKTLGRAILDGTAIAAYSSKPEEKASYELRAKNSSYRPGYTFQFLNAIDDVVRSQAGLISMLEQATDARAHGLPDHEKFLKYAIGVDGESSDRVKRARSVVEALQASVTRMKKETATLRHRLKTLIDRRQEFTAWMIQNGIAPKPLTVDQDQLTIIESLMSPTRGRKPL